MMMEKKNKSKFILLGAGLPRTGTMSTRAALKILLQGDVYHMMAVAHERHDHHHLWRQALDKTISKEGWKTILDEYAGGVDYPVSHFYKEILKVYPDAKVLLNVRDPVKWYQSVRDSILQVVKIQNSWPCTWFSSLMGIRNVPRMLHDLSDPVPTSSSQGIGMFTAVSKGEKTAVQFYHDHVAEVKNHVPANQLLVFEVKQGWEPLCEFLELPVPDCPFPRVNDTEVMRQTGRTFWRLSMLFIVILPLSFCLLSYFGDFNIVYLAILYFAVVVIIRIFQKTVTEKVVSKLTKQKED